MRAHSLAKQTLLPLLAAAYTAGWATLAYYGVRLWRTYCEGFGCTGIGIAWLAWSGAYVVALLAGGLTFRALRGTLRRIVGSVLASQTVAGATLLGYWATHITT